MYQLFPIDTFMVSYYIYGRHKWLTLETFFEKRIGACETDWNTFFKGSIEPELYHLSRSDSFWKFGYEPNNKNPK